MSLPWRTPFAASDEQLMRRVRSGGDERAFAELLRRWETPIRRLCARMTGDLHLAEELAQETFARLFASRNAYREQARFSTYLWRIALNLCHDDNRKARRRRECSMEEAPFAAFAETTELPADRRMIEAERADLVRGAVTRLPEPYRAVVVLRHYEGLKFREIAETLDIPEGTVKSRMAEALAQLARALKPLADEDAPKRRRTT